MRLIPCLVILLGAGVLAAQELPMNLVFLGDSLTEGVPHFGGETETYPFQVSQHFPGSTYVKLGYRGQTTDFLKAHLDSFITTLYKPEDQNVVVLWAGTNDCAGGLPGCSNVVYNNLVSMARMIRAAGWRVVVVTLIARGNYFSSSTSQIDFPASQAEVNSLLRDSGEFEAVADPSGILSNPSDPTYYWDACHLNPTGYRVVADSVVGAIKRGPSRALALQQGGRVR